MRTRTLLPAALAGPLVLWAGCIDAELDSRVQELSAYCQADVSGVGLVPVETDYLPHVVACENGAASQAALEAQAVAARSYLYYKLDHTGQVSDGTGDQVYTCNNPPGAQHYDAVDNTSGLVLQYMGTQVAAFYVAGALQDPPDCLGGTDDPTGTEGFVTYNEGKSGADIEQTSLGFVDPGNFANRGCMSQNGSHCLSDQGDDFDTILRYYYGEDIEVVETEGPCVIPGMGGDGDMTVDPEGGCGCRAAGNPSGSLFLALLALAALRRRRRA